ncbi:Peptidyl-alpha-hydroxyglycine alpha-amidating lyase 1 [Frankliniella fusca]|uniref:peptidylamidoglycolate lyase n=1 Tax=Frankliniella fusca TaxID=407009 RepID=A0AAE1H3Q4_9NEOP|nr:Peptidyl-alpha-hydroxyglycine alpha-amidating lyase 1 [Frankliniella fusca]
MRSLFLILITSHVGLGVMWNPKTQAAPYPDAVGSPNSDSALLRRRPALDSLVPVSDTHQLVWSEKWPASNVRFGQVSAVSVDKHGQVVVFHRGSHVWNAETFDIEDNYLRKEDGPVDEDTVVVLDPNTGSIIKSWGKGIFYMPHGLTIDSEDNLWVTDVALHQIFKFPSLSSLTKESKTPLMVKGVRFQHGKDDSHFCKPSAVAVMKNGDFFVSDGYCNSRILKYDKEGNLLLVWGRSSFTGTYGIRPGPYQFNVPHALTLAEDLNLVCVADRENGRVLCFNAQNGTYTFEISSDEIGPRLFSVAYSPAKGLFYIVNGPFDESQQVKGFVVDVNTRKILSTFQTGSSQLSDPHDVAVSPDGESVFVVQLDPHRAWKFVSKGSDKESLSSSLPNQSTSSVTSSSTLALSSTPTVKTAIEASNSSLPVGLNLMVNNSIAKAMSAPMVAVISLMVVLLCVTGSGIIWCMRLRRQGRPPVLEFDLSEPGYERNSLMHDDEE